MNDRDRKNAGYGEHGWHLRTRRDGVLWSAVASVIAVTVYWLLFGFDAGGPALVRAFGLGIGTLAGGLLATLYWLPREDS